MKKTVSQEYINGIKEGRAMLEALPSLTLREKQEQYESCKHLVKSFAQPLKDLFRGERDFWKSQIKKGLKQ